MKTFNYIFKGYGKSFRARMAEEQGKLPLTHAINEVAMRCNISKKKARELILKYQPCEWHHTGKYGKRTDYFDTVQIINDFLGQQKIMRKSPYIIVRTEFGFAPKCLKCGLIDEQNQMPIKSLVAQPTCNCYE